MLRLTACSLSIPIDWRICFLSRGVGEVDSSSEQLLFLLCDFLKIWLSSKARESALDVAGKVQAAYCFSRLSCRRNRGSTQRNQAFAPSDHAPCFPDESGGVNASVGGSLSHTKLRGDDELMSTR